MSEQPEQQPTIEDIERRLSLVRGPWKWDSQYRGQPLEGVHSVPVHSSYDQGLALVDRSGKEILGAWNHHCCEERVSPYVAGGTYEFIEHAPTDMAFLLEKVRSVPKVGEDDVFWAIGNNAGEVPEEQVIEALREVIARGNRTIVNLLRQEPIEFLRVAQNAVIEDLERQLMEAREEIRSLKGEQ